MTEQIEPTHDYSDKEYEFIQIQFSQAIESYLKLFTQLVNIGTILAIVDVTILGFSLNGKTVGTVLLASSIPIILLIFTRRMYKIMLPFAYTALSLEKLFGNHNIDWLAKTWLYCDTSPEYVYALEKIISNKSSSERIQELRKVSFPGQGRVGFVALFLLLIAFGHLILAVILYFCFEWQIF